MKPVQRILTAIHGLPEEQRKLIAGVFMAASSLFLFFVWVTVIPGKLSSISLNQISEQSTQPAVQSPLEGLASGVSASVRFIGNQIDTGSMYDMSRKVLNTTDETIRGGSAEAFDSFAYVYQGLHSLITDFYSLLTTN